MEEQDWSGAGNRSLDEWHAKVDEALDAQVALLAALPTARNPPRRLLIADTNTFLTHGDIERWTLDGAAWTLIAVPQVVRELDDKKLDPRLKDRAQSVIEIMWRELASSVALVTGDRNLQNKARYARVAYLDHDELGDRAGA